MNPINELDDAVVQTKPSTEIGMKNIFLVGLPSSGKSTLGKRLARELGYRFVDTDKLIIREEGRSISDIFRDNGEPYFRLVESRVLHTIKQGESLVVATGGGMPCFHDNMSYIKQMGLSVFLDVSPEVILERMHHHRADDRPLNRLDDPGLLENLRQKYTNRRPFYIQADIHVSGNADTATILEKIGLHL